MSFCRFSEGDVYMIPTNKGIMCCGCALLDESPVFTRVEDAIAHLEEHRRAGHKAPYDEAIDMLRCTTIEMENGVAKYDTDTLPTNDVLTESEMI